MHVEQCSAEGNYLLVSLDNNLKDSDEQEQGQAQKAENNTGIKRQ